MSTTVMTHPMAEEKPRRKPRMISAFYLLTFLTGGFFLLAGGKLNSMIDLAVAMFYIAATLLFYALNSTTQEPTLN